MDNKNKKLLILGSVIVGIALLYWFVYRPEQIRKDCYKYTYGTPNNGSTAELIKATDYYYSACLHRNGL